MGTVRNRQTPPLEARLERDLVVAGAVMDRIRDQALRIIDDAYQSRRNPDWFTLTEVVEMRARIAKL